MVGVGIAVAGVAGAAGSAASSKGAASAQEQASQNQIGLQQYEFGVEQQEEQPWIQAGQGALTALTAATGPGGFANSTYTPSNFTQSPEYQGYQFMQNQGDAAITAGAAAKGESLSPATLAALSQFNQGTAATQYQNFYNQGYQQWLNQQNQELGTLKTLGGYGEQSTTASIGANEAATSNELTSLQNYGNAQASGILGVGNAVNNATSGLTQNYINSQYYQSLFGGSNNPSNPSYWGGASQMYQAGNSGGSWAGEGGYDPVADPGLVYQG